MKYAVDRVEEKLVICQNLDTKEMIEIPLNLFNFSVNDGDIIKEENGKYYKDDDYKKTRLDLIREKLNKVRK